MHGVILAAGRGSRMNEVTDDAPKAFLEVSGRTLYDRQRETLADRVDGITVVLGYEATTVRDHLSSADALVLDRWDEYDNAESLRRALERVDDDVLVLNGDVLVAPSVLDRLIRRYEELDGEYNVVGCLPGVQEEHTAIRGDDAGNVVDYGEIRGHRHAGIGIVSRRHHDAATDVLAGNRTGWYPHLYPETPTKRVFVQPDAHIEINRPSDLEAARERLPLVRQVEQDAGKS
ncbi:NTP transferase domain-containing protein [Halomicrococcus sp. SG-WS-1]|uniref:NTP transferase domain-containing protein n=1 Tax=Halomicrococcus sp. SG-WS-1 TaxID=3439057 RepID=UPI003F7B170E